MGDSTGFGAVLGAVRGQACDRYIAVIWVGCKVVRFISVRRLMFASALPCRASSFYVDVAERPADVLCRDDGYFILLRFVVRQAFRLAQCVGRLLVEEGSSRVPFRRTSVVWRFSFWGVVVCVRVNGTIATARRSSTARAASVISPSHAVRHVGCHEWEK